MNKILKYNFNTESHLDVYFTGIKSFILGWLKQSHNYCKNINLQIINKDAGQGKYSSVEDYEYEITFVGNEESVNILNLLDIDLKYYCIDCKIKLESLIEVV